jgi:hypothetical protein
LKQISENFPLKFFFQAFWLSTFRSHFGSRSLTAKMKCKL